MALGTGAMRVPRPAAGMMTRTFIAGCQYTSAQAASSNAMSRCPARCTTTYNVRIFAIGRISFMLFARQVGHWLVSNAQTIYYLMATAGAFVAVLTYYRNSTIERARWPSSLYSKFYEAPDLKRIRKCLDESLPDAAEITDLVRNEDPDFTDYLNFFEFMAYLEDRRQLSSRDVAALFDYYLRVLSKHKEVREYVLEDRNGYGYLKKLLPRFPPVD